MYRGVQITSNLASYFFIDAQCGFPKALTLIRTAFLCCLIGTYVDNCQYAIFLCFSMLMRTVFKVYMLFSYGRYARLINLTAQSIELAARSIDLTAQSIDLTAQSIDLTAQSIDLTAQSIDRAARSIDCTVHLILTKHYNLESKI